MTDLKALTYPSCFPPCTRWKRFFLGVRWLGPDLHFFEELRDIQGARTPESMLYWKSESHRTMAANMGEIFSRTLRWPTEFFLSEDRFAVIFGGPKFNSFGCELDAKELIGEIEESTGVGMSDEFWASSSSSTLGMIVDQMVATKASLCTDAMTNLEYAQ